MTEIEHCQHTDAGTCGFCYREQEAKLNEFKTIAQELGCDRPNNMVSVLVKVRSLQARIKEQQNIHEKQVHSLNLQIARIYNEREQAKSRIAALELALKPFAQAHKNNAQGKVTLHDFRMAAEALSGFKLGELFKALLEEHKKYGEASRPDIITNHGLQWGKAEAFRKECEI